MEEAITIRRDVRDVIEEMSKAYDSFSLHDQVNADYAGFATMMAAGKFRDALRQPDLSSDVLAMMLREAISQHRSCDITRSREQSWTRYAAWYVSQSSNGNDPTSIM